MSSTTFVQMPPQVVSSALSAFCAGRFDEFDPLVGDTACHIRAAKVCDLAEMLFKSEEFGREVALAIQSPSLPMSGDLNFLIQCYFLNFIKEIIPQGHTYLERTNTKQAAQMFQISSSKVEDLRKKVQKLMAGQSVDYIESRSKHSLKMFFLDPYCLKDGNNRPLIPCYFSMRVILKESRYILLKCNEISFLYEGGSYEYPKYTDMKSIPIEIQKMPAMVVKGFSLPPKDGLGEALKEISLKIMLLANAAAHSQYAGDRSIPFPEKPEDLIGHQQEKFLEMKQRAEVLGCSITNPSLFCIDHIFCAQIGSQR